MPNRRRSMRFDSIIQDGEAKNAPDGFRAQTANGTTHARTTGWNKDTPMPTMPTVEAGGAWQKPNSNRGGE